MPDDDVSGLLEQLGFLGEVEESSDDFWHMPLVNLYTLIHKLDNQLSERNELLSQHTQDARDLHSRRGAAMIAYRSRTFGQDRDRSEG